MTAKKHYNFHREFHKIDERIKQEEHREAGYLCGYMLEHMLLRIYEKFKGKASKDVLDNLAETNDGKLNTFKLGQLIGFFNRPYRTAKQTSNRITPSVFKVVCDILEVDYKRVRFIELEKLNDIRNKCVHPHPYNNEIDITKDEIEGFKADLNTIATDFQHLFHMELTDYHPPASSSSPAFPNKLIKSINYEIVIIIASITLVGIAAVIVFIFP